MNSEKYIGLDVHQAITLKDRDGVPPRAAGCGISDHLKARTFPGRLKNVANLLCDFDGEANDCPSVFGLDLDVDRRSLARYPFGKLPIDVAFLLIVVRCIKQ